MLKRIVGLIVLSLYFITFPVTSLEAVSQVRSYSYKIYNDTSHGSGVVIAPNLMLTAAHIVDGNSDLKVNGKPIKRIIKSNAKTDIALIEVEISCPCVAIAQNIPEMDQKVYTVGYPLGMEQFLTEGRVQYFELPKNRMITSIPVIFGNSGGGVFTLEDGTYKLVGIVSGVAQICDQFMPVCTPVTHLSAIVDLLTLKGFLKDVWLGS